MLFTHVPPIGQAWPQRPQLYGSRLVAKHVPLQHVSPELQARLHAPQLSGSVWGFMQRFPQRIPLLHFFLRFFALVRRGATPSAAPSPSNERRERERVCTSLSNC